MGEFREVPGVRTTYSSMAIDNAGAVAHRGFGCWCKPCANAVGRAAGTMDATCRVRGCTSAAKDISGTNSLDALPTGKTHVV